MYLNKVLGFGILGLYTVSPRLPSNLGLKRVPFFA